MDSYDVAIIGAGIVGSAIAMDLSRLVDRVAILEASSDVGNGTSKANSAILHTGFDAPPGSLEARLVRRGYERYHEWSAELGLPISHTGALLVAWNEEQAAQFPAVVEKAEQNGVTGLDTVGPEKLYRLEPKLGPGALQAIVISGESITCPFTPVLAYATNAVSNGAALFTNFPMKSAGRANGMHVLSDGTRSIQASTVVNAAGLWSDEIDRLFGKSHFTVKPRKGEFIVFDKPASNLLRHIILPVPTKRTKGVLVAPTVFGNVLLGPTAIDIADKTDVSVGTASLRLLMDAGHRLLPDLERECIAATYAGLRAATEFSDYQIHSYPEEGYISVGSIRSTGLTASLGISEYVSSLVIDGHPVRKRTGPEWKSLSMPPITNLVRRACEDPERIAANPEYGAIVCHCEWVSRGEILDTFDAPIPAVTLDGIKRRTRAMLGRCQGFNCHAPIAGLLARAGAQGHA